MDVAIQQGHPSGGRAQERISPIQPLLTPKEAARTLRVSVSFLAKACMTGNGPALIKIGRAIRYTEANAAAVDENESAPLDLDQQVEQ